MSRDRHDSEGRRQERMIREILKRTSGSPCGRAGLLLSERTDGDLAVVDGRLLEMHLEHCAGCRALAATLEWMRQPLADLAEIDPGPAFTAAVLARTRPRRRLWQAWRELWQRPRFAWEAAYVGAMVLGLLFAAPGSPLKEVPGQALRVAQANPVQAVSQRAAAVVPDAAREWGGEAWQATGGRATGIALAWRDGLWSRLSGAWDAGRPLPGQVGGLGAAVLDGKGTAAAFGQVRATTGAIWSELFTSGSEIDPSELDQLDQEDSSGERS